MAQPGSRKIRRRDAAVLVVSRDPSVASRLKQSLHSIGYSNVSTTNNHGQGLERIKGRNFQLIFFDAVETNMSALDFVTAVSRVEDACHLIALSAQPSIDQVFELLRAGARWFLVLPFTVDTIEEVLSKAIDGPPFSEGVLDAADRNAALVSIILNALEDLATAMRHIRSFPDAPLDAVRYKYSFQESVALAKTFADGGNEKLLEKICDGCLNRALHASTRLGRVRKRLQKLRTKKPQSKHEAAGHG